MPEKSVENFNKPPQPKKLAKKLPPSGKKPKKPVTFAMPQKPYSAM